MTFDDRLTTLDALWSAWAECGRTTAEEQWKLPTRLGDWDLRSLYAHAASWPFTFPRLVDRVSEAEPTHATAAELLRDFNAPGGAAHRLRDWNAAGAREDAVTYSIAQLIDRFAGAGPDAIAAARRRGPVPVDYHGLAVLRLDEVVSIGILEATVHLLDVQRALDLPPHVPADGLAHTAALLAAMAPPVDFIEAATGRSAAQPFPVLT
ncbi:maleylpyruvate isomerase N-terminal domain-containing protein [Actinoplanes sp. NPDC049599]|uniref:maleylpyruvate isomerase N-terminal domain-containing protein n=1 Tax=Actinoplanes sp. NPDC049599 TaxID=3363903 RepID=UPI00378B0D5D